jgi:hypothetical protein
MTAGELRQKLSERSSGSAGNQSAAARRLELLAAERAVARFLAGKKAPSEFATGKLAEIIVRHGIDHEEVGTAYVADPEGLEVACRSGVRRLRYHASRFFRRALGD